MPRPKKDSDGNVVPSAPKAPAEVLDTLATRISRFAMENSISVDSVTDLITNKFSTEREAVQREQVKQLAERLTPEQLSTLLAQAGIATS